MKVKLGELVNVKNANVEFGEKTEGYIGGYINVDGKNIPVIFTRREVDAGISRYIREQENFDNLCLGNSITVFFSRFFNSKDV